MGRQYALPILSLTALTAVPFSQLAPPAGMGIRLLGIELSQEASEVSQQEMLTLARRSTASTLPTPATPLRAIPTDLASVLTGSTTTNAVGIATVTGTLVDLWPLPSFNCLNGFDWTPRVDMRLPPLGFWTLQFKNAPAANTWNGLWHFEELN